MVLLTIERLHSQTTWSLVLQLYSHAKMVMNISVSRDHDARVLCNGVSAIVFAKANTKQKHGESAVFSLLFPSSCSHSSAVYFPSSSSKKRCVGLLLRRISELRQVEDRQIWERTRLHVECFWFPSLTLLSIFSRHLTQVVINKRHRFDGFKNTCHTSHFPRLVIINS